MTERPRVHEAAARVRGLLEKLASPHPALQYIVQGVDAHVASLSPHLSILDVTPFGALPDIMPEAHGRSEDAQRRRRRSIEPPQQRTYLRSALEPGPGQRPARRVVENPPALQRAAAPVLPIGSGERRPARDGAEQQEPVTRAPVEAPQAAQAARAAVRPPEGGLGTARNMDAPVDLGALVERVLRHTRGVAPVRSVEHTGAGAASGRVQAQTARTVVRRTPGETHVLSPSSAARSSAEHDVVAGRAPVMATDVEPGTPAAAVQPSVQRARTAPLFYFDPLEPRAGADDTDDALAERIGQVLREQARRQGVDVT